MTQQESLDILKAGYNVYLTGSAGSGKTYVLDAYIRYLHLQNKKVGITASTGVAATHLSGITIHAWAGIGVRQKITDQDLSELLKRKYLHKRFEETDVLVIDEVSMLSSDTFESIDLVLRRFRQSDEPFGGMQIVLCGDFFQLPPIGDTQTNRHFIYKSPLWEALDLKICYLDKPYRQDDKVFLQILSEIRENAVTSRTWDLLKERFLQPLDRNITPTKLYTHNDRADAINAAELARLHGPTHMYKMKMYGNEILSQMMRRNSLAPEVLVLKKGAFVMFVKNNFEEGYVNGTMGKIIDFTEEGYPVVDTYSGKRIQVTPVEWVMDEVDVYAKISQLPLRLAWAITIHKSQGMSLDAAEIDLGRSFVEGLGYVALSRVRSLSGIKLKSINRTALTVNDEVIELDRELKKKSDEIVDEMRN